MSHFGSVQFCQFLHASTELAQCNLNVKALQYFSSCNVCNSLIAAAFLFLFDVAFFRMLRAPAIRYLSPVPSLHVFIGCSEKMTYSHLCFCDLDTHYEMAMNIRVRE